MKIQRALLSLLMSVFATLPLQGQASITLEDSTPSEDRNKPVTAHYLVVTAGEQRSLLVSHYQQVQMKDGFQPLDDAQLQSRAAELASRQNHAATVRLLDVEGRLLYQDVVKFPRWKRSEVMLDDQPQPSAESQDRRLPTQDIPRQEPQNRRMQRHLEPLFEATFVIRVPVIPGGDVLEVSPGERFVFGAERLDLADLSRQFVGQEVRAVAGETHEAFPSFTNGPANNRLDILFVAESYRSNDLHWFRFDTDGLANRLVGETPFNSYKSFLNLWRLHVPSAQTGADRPACNDPQDGGLDNGQMVNTAFDASYCSSPGVWRNLQVNDQKVLTAAASYPDWDQILVVVQSPIRGGSGGQVAVTSLGESYAITDDIVDLMVHELGHSFGGLADEYIDAAFAMNYPACSDINSNPLDDCEPNVTDIASRNSIKWKHWITSSTPIPTTNPGPFSFSAGLWMGARYLPAGMFRQCFNGKMNVASQPFCSADREALLLKFYQGGWGTPAGGISLIEPGTRSPSSTFLTVSPGQSKTLKAKVLSPLSRVRVEWFVNGIKVRTESAANGTFPSYTFREFQPGVLRTVKMRVTDQDFFIHTSQRSATIAETSWTIQVNGSCGTC